MEHGSCSLTPKRARVSSSCGGLVRPGDPSDRLHVGTTAAMLEATVEGVRSAMTVSRERVDLVQR